MNQMWAYEKNNNRLCNEVGLIGFKDIKHKMYYGGVKCQEKNGLVMTTLRKY